MCPTWKDVIQRAYKSKGGRKRKQPQLSPRAVTPPPPPVSIPSSPGSPKVKPLVAPPSTPPPALPALAPPAVPMLIRCPSPPPPPIVYMPPPATQVSIATKKPTLQYAFSAPFNDCDGQTHQMKFFTDLKDDCIVIKDEVMPWLDFYISVCGPSYHSKPLRLHLNPWCSLTLVKNILAAWTAFRALKYELWSEHGAKLNDTECMIDLGIGMKFMGVCLVVLGS